MGTGAGDGISELTRLVVTFSRQRAWNHDSKNLAMSVAIEAAEIMELFQWTDTEEPLAASDRQALALECADVLWYLLRLCAEEGLDLAAALRAKMEINARRFPPDADADGRPGARS